MGLLFTFDEACGLLGTNAAELRSKVQAGAVRALMVNGTWKVWADDIYKLAGREGRVAVAPTVSATPAAAVPVAVPAAPAAAPVAAPVAAAPVLPSTPIGLAPLEASPPPAANGNHAPAPTTPAASEKPKSSRTKKPAPVKVKAPPPVEDEDDDVDVLAELAEEQVGASWDSLIRRSLEAEPAPEETPKKDDPKANGKDGGKPQLRTFGIPSKPGSSPEPMKPTTLPDASFVPIECPNFECRAMGKVPFHKLNDQLNCPTCGTRFYIDPLTSETVVGELSAGTPAVAAKPQTFKKPDEDVVKKFDAALMWWGKATPKQKWKVRIGALLVIALLAGAWQLRGPWVGSHPRERTQYMLDALARNSVGRVKSLSSSKSQTADITAWFGKSRPSFWSEEGVPPDGQVSVRSIKPNLGKAVTEVFIPEPLKPGQEGKPRQYHVTFFWTSEGGSWWFDVNESLKVPPEYVGGGKDPAVADPPAKSTTKKSTARATAKKASEPPKGPDGKAKVEVEVP